MGTARGLAIGSRTDPAAYEGFLLRCAEVLLMKSVSWCLSGRCCRVYLAVWKSSPEAIASEAKALPRSLFLLLRNTFVLLKTFSEFFFRGTLRLL